MRSDFFCIKGVAHQKIMFSKIETKAALLGYKVDENGNVTNRHGRAIGVWPNMNGYLQFSPGGGNRKCTVHRLQAYQKFGDAIYTNGIEVRHLDGNKLNNRAENIAIGTPHQNAMDRNPSVRFVHANAATSGTQKHDHHSVFAAHKGGMSYGEIMKRFNISSKGTVSFIVNKSITKSLSE